MKKLYQTPSTEERKEVRMQEIDTAMQYIYSYLEENSEECQFSLDELMTKIEGDYRPHIKTVKAQLLKKYGDDILIAVTANEAPVRISGLSFSTMVVKAELIKGQRRRGARDAVDYRERGAVGAARKECVVFASGETNAFKRRGYTMAA
ncbi:hypothetical protein EVAR_7817_1 [Eumeta japonica]|uniref:Uncharacterized protein n=1 Tax=Eumeta variegata TaxID=151549 RepID=A0A4C1TVB0_EUMVA|nr:hypothetical protein EVAR_7817_1 [Eumeta japonica]